jgi:hypothetical protein
MLSRNPNRGRCERVLGTDERLQAYAAFWRDYGDGLQNVVLAELIEYTEKRSFSSEEWDLVREVLAVVPIFFENCLREVEIKKFKEGLPKDTV